MRIVVGIGALVVALIWFVDGSVKPSTPSVATVEAQTTGGADAASRILSSAQSFLTALDKNLQARVQFPFNSPQKARWSNLPSGIFQREGVRIGDLSQSQRAAAMALLSTALSQEGYRKVLDIVRGDEMLRGGGGGRGVMFGENEYFLSFVGTPSADAPWMLQFGGHHLAINMTFAGARGTLAPTHTGAQPATYTFEGRTVRPLGDENDLAFALMDSLDANQKKQAILGYSVSDLVLGPGQDGRMIQPEGLQASSLSAAQQTKLLEIVRGWAGIANDALAAPRMEEIRANRPQTYFAWSGPTTNGSAAYFRIQGPTLVIEYAPQRSVDHIHTIYRDPTNDYGAAFTRK